jgi:hypothetical protein
MSDGMKQRKLFLVFPFPQVISGYINGIQLAKLSTSIEKCPTYNTMAKRKGTKGQTMIHKTLQSIIV